MSVNLLFTWLVNGALASTVLLVCGSAVVSRLLHPDDKLRVVQWTLGTTIVSLVLVTVPSLSLFSLGLVRPGDAGADSGVNFEADSSAPFSSARRKDRDAARNAPGVPILPRVESQEIATTSPEPLVSHIDWKGQRMWLVCFAYLMGMIAFLARWAIARVRLHRIFSGARPAPHAIRAELLQTANRGCDHVALLVSDDISTPIMCGMRRPAIVLPSSVISDGDHTRLRYFLAHEWAHVSQRHFATWQLATILQFFLYYQPLFWWLRRQLSTSMDQLADAAASGEGASTIDYAEFLLQLARRNLAPAPQLTLGIHDKHSPLRHRITYLLEAAMPARLFCSLKTRIAIGTGAISLCLFASAVRLDAHSADGKANTDAHPGDAFAAAERPAELEKVGDTVSQEGNVEAITYTGTVSDRVTGKPIAGAKIEVRHMLSRDPKTGGWTTIEVTEHMSDADGKYQFTLPPEQVAEDSLYIEVSAHHPDFAAKGRSGYSHAMIRKNLKLGEQPFYSQIKLWPGEAITGKVVSPEGRPMSDVEISMYSTATDAERFRGSFDRTKTDETGHFRIVPPKNGDGVLWILPAEYSPQAHRIGDRRGDWGTITVQAGTAIFGRVLDVQGAGVGGVKVEARRSGDGEEPDEFLNNNSVANQIGRETVSDAEGKYTLASLPVGEYELRISQATESYDPQPLEHVFLRQQVTIGEDKRAKEVDIRAIPHVAIRASILDSAGKPKSGHQATLFGRMDGGFYAEMSSTPGKNGKLEIRAPRGLQQAELDLITNEHSALRWRMSPDAPLRRGRRVKLGTLDEDISGMEIVRYAAPIVLVKPVDEEGAPMSDCTPIATYTRPAQDDEELTTFTTGGHVNFEHQEDGRWRSSQALPDEPMSISVRRPGYETTPQETSLKEGEERELVFVMKKSGEAKPDTK